ncbi:uncharacterized protein LOC120332810 [Styela clava]
MRLIHLLLVLTLAVALLEISECRLNRKSSERARSKNERRKLRNQGRLRGKKRNREHEVTTSSLATTTDDSALLVEDLQNIKSKYIEEFLGRRTSLLGGQSLFDNLPSLRNSNTTNHYTEALLSAFVIPIPVQNKTEIMSSVSTASELHFKGKFGFHSPHSNVFGRIIHVSDAGFNDSHVGCSGKIANEEEVANVGGPWIALIARGKCKFFFKIKLAEKYGARAVIVYDTVPRRIVEVMRTIGTKIMSLMVNAADGGALVRKIEQGNKIYINISVGAINIEASDLIPKVAEYSYTEAIVDFRLDSSNPVEVGKIPFQRTTARYGRYSPRIAFSGRLVHVIDVGTENSHFGCTGAFSNEEEIKSTKGEWIALIEAGKCNNVVKIKLAEKYSAKAVIIYDEDFKDEPTVMNTIGTKISALTITRQDGKMAAQLLRNGQISHLNVTIGATISGVSSKGYSLNCTIYNSFVYIFSLLICCVTHFHSH